MTRPVGLSDKEYFERVATEAEFLDWYKQQDAPRFEKPSVTADMVVYSFVDGQIKLLLIRRAAHPCQHKLSLVGGFIGRDEDAYQTCQRQIKKEAGLDLPRHHIEQLLTISDPNRDPRGWVMTIAHLVYLPSQALDLVQAGEDGREPIVIDVDFKKAQCSYQGQLLTAEDFAFDHYEIVMTSIKRIQGRMKWNPTFLNLLQTPFTIYAATDLVNLISPDKKILHNNFLSKYGEYVEEAGVERVPKKKPKKTYRLKAKQTGN
ncbi:NUDIX domain-containing protein [Streptococcus oriscaviae]|uniref:NUDIX hydrolase n=1 Tax=Streptococcus oriscaviae TaxID=2781599 RepID=A0ABX7YK10_9STRE|nr:NUDIX domain-containing protein [Streptococcus oriscaviae]QUE53807.1 NUDIX hydrolase [Streptococcus oriscaviae]